jgi:hypothetical protein
VSHDRHIRRDIRKADAKGARKPKPPRPQMHRAKTAYFFFLAAFFFAFFFAAMM